MTMSTDARHLLRPATVRVLPAALSLRQDRRRRGGSRRRSAARSSSSATTATTTSARPAPPCATARRASRSSSTSPSTTRCSGSSRRSTSSGSAPTGTPAPPQQLPRLRGPPLGRGVPRPSARRTSPISAWRCTGGWGCSRASASCARATRPSGVRPATWTITTWMCPTKARSCGPAWWTGRLKLHKGGDRIVHLPATRVHQGADQPDARHAAALDAVGDALHPLRGRRGRAGLPAQGGRAGDHLRRPRHDRSGR